LVPIDGWEGEEILTEGDDCTMTTDGFTNRIIDVQEEVILPAVCWESCVDCAVGLEEIDFDAFFTISPNPSVDVFNINVSNEVVNPIDITIFNMLGEQVGLTKTARQGNFTLDLSKEPAGIYFVKLNEGSHSTLKRITKIN